MVCQQLGISRSQLHVWLKRDKLGLGLQTQPGRGRKTALHPVAKRVIRMATEKRHQSTRKLARRLTKAGYKTSHMMIHRYLRNNLAMRPFKLKRTPKLTEKQRAHRLKFAREHLHWSEEEWRKVVWSDESPFELFHPPNRQNDRVWAASSSDVPTVPSVKHPAKIHVWGMFSYRALSQLHVVPPKNDHQRRVLSEQHPGQRMSGGAQPDCTGGSGFQTRADARSKPSGVHAGRRTASQRQKDSRLVP